MGTALVTGGTAGIGHAFARRLAADGYDLVLVARDGDRLAQVAAELGARYGTAVEVMVADLAVRADVARVADRLAGAPVDVLVNNAGFGLNTSFLGSDAADQERLLDVLCRAVLVISHAGAKAMVARGSGAIVNVSSVAGFAAMGTYGAAKAWVTAFTEALAVELSGTGVTATALCPGFVRTQFHDRARMNMSRLPARAWLDADTVVDACLADVRRGRVVSVPSARYRVAVFLARHAPRPLVRGVSNGVAQRRRRR